MSDYPESNAGEVDHGWSFEEHKRLYPDSPPETRLQIDHIRQNGGFKQFVFHGETLSLSGVGDEIRVWHSGKPVTVLASPFETLTFGVFEVSLEGEELIVRHA